CQLKQENVNRIRKAVNCFSKVLTDPAKRLTTISEKVQKTVNQIQEKTSLVASVATVAGVAG
ncbi:MAG: hypothetical protein IKQ37_10235, partial [Bacteroidaceae bacterium]|nr:hypothetical protein [Bacteroidaceae bacterium]